MKILVDVLSHYIQKNCTLGLNKHYPFNYGSKKEFKKNKERIDYFTQTKRF